MASQRTAWIAAGILARLLMIAVLLLSVRFNLANYTNNNYYNDFNKLQSYTYAVASAIVGMGGSLLQIPVAIYLLCKSARMTLNAIILDTSLYADMVLSLVLASGVGAGFGATNDVMRYVRAIPWNDSDIRSDLTDYYNRGIVAVVFLLVGMLLSICAMVVSARLRARAIKDREGV